MGRSLGCGNKFALLVAYSHGCVGSLCFKLCSCSERDKSVQYGALPVIVFGSTNAGVSEPGWQKGLQGQASSGWQGL